MRVVPFRRARGREARWVRWVNASVACGFTVAGGGAASAGDSLVNGAQLFGAAQITHVSGEVQAPAFELTTTDGKTVALATLRGKVVFLNFWATWCPPCKKEMPSMERLHQEFKEQGLVVLAGDLQESPKQVARFMRDSRLTFPALLDADGKVSELYSVAGLPSTYLIDRTGRVIGQAVGERDWASPAAKALVRSLLEPAAARQ